MPDQSIDPRLVEQTRQHIRQLVAEINQLAGADIPPQQFFGEFLTRVVSAVAAVGGAVWSRDGGSQPRLQHQVNFQVSGLLEEGGAGGHAAIVMHAFSNGQAKLIPPRSGAAGEAERDVGANSSEFSLIVSPMRVDKHTVGVVELLLDPSRRQSAMENAVRFVSELCDIGAGYLKNRQLRQMLGQQHLWTQLEAFVRQIHASLSPKEVAYIVANEGKRLVACDRLSVAVVYGRKPVIDAVSGQEVVERKSTLVQLMARLTNAVLRSKENLFYAGEEIEGLPPAVHDALDDFLAESGSKVLAITLLRTTNKEGTPGDPFGAIIGELLQDATTAGSLAPRMDVVAQHGAITLANALSHHRVFMLPVWRFVGNWSQWMRGNRLAKLAVAVAGIAAITAAMVFIPLELRMQGRGTLQPENRQQVYAWEDGLVTQVLVDHGQMVKQGQVLVQMHSEVFDLDRRNLGQKVDEANAMILSDDGREGGANRAVGVAARATALARITLVDQRIDSLRVRATEAGMIATWEPKRTLIRRPVKQGDPLLTIAQVDGGWILEVKMPEHKIGHILEADSRRKAEGNAEPLTAWFILANHPQKQFRGTVERIATTAELDHDDKEHIVMIRIRPDDVEKVEPIFDREPDEADDDPIKVKKVRVTFKDGTVLPVNPGAEVRAKVDCGKRAMGYVLLRELIEFVYETVLF